MTSLSSQLPDDLPAWELVFRFTSGRLCLAFCATVGERWRRNFERLRDPHDLARWVREAGLAGDELPVTQRVLGEARSLREAIYRSVRAGMDASPPAEADRDLLNRWARRPGLAPQLAANGTLSTWAGPSPIQACLSAVARDAVELLASPDIRRVRECAAPDCALLFLDRSRPGHRRWCADNACSAKARSAAYRQRKKTSANAHQ
jgi:predicted RNA-binding Zn ribbon-like protein